MLTSSVIYPNGIYGRGTLGGFFSFPGNQTIYGITNNHVIANINHCQINDPVYDESGTVVGNLSHWKILNDNNGLNLMDVALFEYNGAAGPPRWRLPAGVREPRGFLPSVYRGHVYMVLSDNRIRRGYISQRLTSSPIDFVLCGRHFLFTHLIEVISFDGGAFSLPGDSGSILFSSNHCVVGLIMGASLDNTRSYAVPFIEGILQAYPLHI